MSALVPFISLWHTTSSLSLSLSLPFVTRQNNFCIISSLLNIIFYVHHMRPVFFIRFTSADSSLRRIERVINLFKHGSESAKSYDKLLFKEEWSHLSTLRIFIFFYLRGKLVILLHMEFEGN